jgi:hypothetical protein
MDYKTKKPSTMEVLVFKTSVETPQSVKTLKPLLDSVAGRGRWNFALDDCDKILRIASVKVKAHVAIQLLNEKGYECAELED